MELLDLLSIRVAERSIDPGVAQSMMDLLGYAKCFSEATGESPEKTEAGRAAATVARHLLAQL